MAVYTVDPEALIAASSVVDGIAGEATFVSRAACSDAGHAGVAASMSEFNANIADSWQSRLSATTAVADGLRRTAQIFQSADDDGASEGRALDGTAF